MKKDGKAVSLLKKSFSIAGASVANVVSALIGGTVAGLPGSAAGAAAAKACEIVIEDIADRMLSTREQHKVGGVAALAIDGIRERLLWEPPRDDGFFNPPQERSCSKEYCWPPSRSTNGRSWSTSPASSPT